MGLKYLKTYQISKGSIVKNMKVGTFQHWLKKI